MYCICKGVYHFVQIYTHANYGGTIKSESLRITIMFLAFVCSKPIHCSAIHMFVYRGLPTCKMLVTTNFQLHHIQPKSELNRKAPMLK